MKRMMKPSSNAFQQKGFTLLELMVVLVIIGSLLGMVTVAYQVDDDEEVIKLDAQSVKLFLQHQIDQSWLDGKTLGAKVSAKEINLFEFDLENEVWLETAFNWVPDAEQVEISLLLSDTEKRGDIAKSSLAREVDLAFVASGEYSPFELSIQIVNDTSDTHSFLLEGDGVNALKLSEN